MTRHAKKKSPAQLQREINEALAKPIQTFREWRAGRPPLAEMSPIALTTEVRNMLTMQRLRPSEERQRYIEEIEAELRAREARIGA